MIFEGPDGLFCGIAPVYIRGHQLVICSPLLLDGAAILLSEFIVQGLEVNFMATFFDAHVDVVVFCNTMVVVFGSEGLHKYDIVVLVVSQHIM